MSVTGDWISVGNSSLYHRLELYGPDWSSEINPLIQKTMIPAPFGGPLLLIDGNFVRIFRSSGQEISSWKWRSNASNSNSSTNVGVSTSATMAARVFNYDWSHEETAVFITEDGTVFVYDLHGEIIHTLCMGIEAKDLKIIGSKVVRNDVTTAVVILTSALRFFYVSSLSNEARVRKMPDLDTMTREIAWTVWIGGGDDDNISGGRIVKIVVAVTVFQLDVLAVGGILTTWTLDLGNSSTIVSKITHLEMSYDYRNIAVVYDTGLVWLGRIENNVIHKLAQYQMDMTNVCRVAWCANDGIVCFADDSASPCIITVKGEVERIFLLSFITCVQEIDGLRIFSQTSGQELLQTVPKIVEETFKIGSIAPSAMLHSAAEEFYNKSYKAEEYLRMVMPQLSIAVRECVEAAGYMFDTYYQKSLIKSAQFGKSFVNTTQPLSDSFAKMSKTLRVLNALRNVRVGIPLTLAQYEYLTPTVVVDRLLTRRLYPLAIQICQLLNIPAELGHNRILAHWACYKVAKQEDDTTTAKVIISKLGSHPSISYCDIAARAAEYGKNDLAVQLLDHEARAVLQIPLLMKLGQESNALSKALSTGDRDLAFLVIFKLKKKLSAADFHILIRKYPLGKIIYQNYCQQYDAEALDDWYVQEDDFSSLAKQSFCRAWESSGQSNRLAILVQSAENFKKAKNQEMANYVEENSKLLKLQANLEEKLGRMFLSKSLHETVCDLVTIGELKLAEKVKSDFKLADRRFAWLKASSLAKSQQWTELKTMVKGGIKKSGLSAASLLKVVKSHGGEEKVNEFLNDNLLIPNQQERVTVLSEFGMYLEAATAAFSAKNMDALNRLESLVKTQEREDILQRIISYKARLLR